MLRHHLLFLAWILLFIPEVVFGQASGKLSYKSITELPGGFQGEQASLSDLLNTLYVLSISIAAILAVVKIIVAGLKYSLSGSVTNKSEAINDIKGSLLGLIVIISAVLVLTVINPRILGAG